MTFARHVYQAGSRVGAVMVGWSRNCQPRTKRRRAATSTITHQEPWRFPFEGSGTVTAWACSVSVRAIEATSYFPGALA